MDVLSPYWLIPGLSVRGSLFPGSPWKVKMGTRQDSDKEGLNLGYPSHLLPPPYKGTLHSHKRVNRHCSLNKAPIFKNRHPDQRPKPPLINTEGHVAGLINTQRLLTFSRAHGQPVPPRQMTCWLAFFHDVCVSFLCKRCGTRIQVSSQACFLFWNKVNIKIKIKPACPWLSSLHNQSLIRKLTFAPTTKGILLFSTMSFFFSLFPQTVIFTSTPPGVLFSLVGTKHSLSQGPD